MSDARSKLQETRDALGTKRADLVQLWSRGQVVEEMMRLLDEMSVPLRSICEPVGPELMPLQRTSKVRPGHFGDANIREAAFACFSIGSAQLEDDQEARAAGNWRFNRFTKLLGWARERKLQCTRYSTDADNSNRPCEILSLKNSKAICT